ncbi:hypothetical protein FHX82_001855 [Amycolatopsis bartoniae]|uniref:DUF4232 domain-containing protein n=1 Tax=Amycolatopsis bartoniae TaxID=941986 RepID=A0A8H9IRV0_9PSEU|nr:DUF4232 domain-containing protein [Amycolatopsis bartoniae]MBB2934835.1 hypothetical protein [Amycolatopsis bartoniae]TVT03076.1 DUF4232 domain-containing protein [Amycolatopsis bartoniae]GHF44446.1 hypothetical protein GCM10017566_16680 [Amycolatopsis bartoniae]
MIKHTIAAGAVVGLVAGGLLVTSGTAGASPSDQPCGIADVHIAVTRDSTVSAGQEGYAITYTAASPTTNCKLEGIPTAVTFMTGHNTAVNVTVVPDAPAATPATVNLTATHPAVSYLLQEAAAPVTAVPSALNLNLPSAQAFSTTVEWPEGAPLKGDVVEVTAVAPAA